MRRSYWLTRPDDKPITPGELRAILREEASHILREPRRSLPEYGIKPTRRSRRKSKRGGPTASKPKPAPKPPIYAASEGYCCVYAIGCPGHPVKVGIAYDVAARVRALQTGFPYRLRIYVAVEVPEEVARAAEQECHRRLRAKRLTGEWFDVTPREAADCVEAVAASMA